MNKKYTHNKKFFNKIDSKEKAYILGLLYADGNNFVSEKRCKISLVLQTKDIELLKEVNFIIGSNRPLQISKNTAILHLSGKEYSEQLISLGCTPRKSLTLKFPTIEQVSEEFISHFIRGYFDGDGCISFGKRYKSASMAGTDEFLLEIKEILGKLDIKSTISKRISISELRITSKSGIKKFHDYIYKDNIICLNRKNNKFLELFKTY